MPWPLLLLLLLAPMGRSMEEDNSVLTLLRGQPEVEASLGLPSDEDSYNELRALLGLGGTHHFVSSSFPEVDSRGFHESVFDGVGDYYPSWQRAKRDPLGINSRGFHDDVFNRDFGVFHTVKRVARSQSENNGNKVDYIMPHRQKRDVGAVTSGSQGATHAGEPELMQENGQPSHLDGPVMGGLEKGSSNIRGGSFSNGFKDFRTKKKREIIKRGLKSNASAPLTSHIPAIIDDYWAVQKRRLGMGPSGFHADTFSGGFGDFSPMKRAGDDDETPPQESRVDLLLRQLQQKRRPEMDASGFHGDTFKGGFGDFWSMKKRRPEMDSSGFHGDTFNAGGFGDFWTMKKRRPEMDSSGFHGDTFNAGGFGDFWTMKKRRPEMDSSGFHGDTFNGGFGDFWPMKRSVTADDKPTEGNNHNSHLVHCDHCNEEALRKITNNEELKRP